MIPHEAGHSVHTSVPGCLSLMYMCYLLYIYYIRACNTSCTHSCYAQVAYLLYAYAIYKGIPFKHWKVLLLGVLRFGLSGSVLCHWVISGPVDVPDVI